MATHRALAYAPAGLTDLDAARIAAAIAAGRAPTTRAVYGCAWRAWILLKVGDAPELLSPAVGG